MNVQAVGSALELKKQFGAGYLLHILKAGNFKGSVVLASVTSYIEGVQLSSNAGSEMTLSLPLGQEANFVSLFDLFDTQKAVWGIQAYGLSLSTLEEVFLKLARLQNDDQLHDKDVADQFTNQSNMPLEIDRLDTSQVSCKFLHHKIDDPGLLTGSPPAPCGISPSVSHADILESFECQTSWLRQLLSVLSAGVWLWSMFRKLRSLVD